MYANLPDECCFITFQTWRPAIETPDLLNGIRNKRFIISTYSPSEIWSGTKFLFLCPLTYRPRPFVPLRTCDLLTLFHSKRQFLKNISVYFINKRATRVLIGTGNKCFRSEKCSKPLRFLVTTRGTYDKTRYVYKNAKDSLFWFTR